MADPPQYRRSCLVGLRDGDAPRRPARAAGVRKTGEEEGAGAGRATCLSEKPKHFVNVAPGESANTADPWETGRLCVGALLG